MSDTDRQPSSPPHGGAYSSEQLRRVRDLLTRIYAARRTLRFYPAEHEATKAAIADLKAVIDRFHEEGADVTLNFWDGELIFGEQLMTEESILFDQLIREMTVLGVGSLEFLQGGSASELVTAIAALSADPGEIEQQGGVASMLQAAGVRHVRAGAVRPIERTSSEEEGVQNARAAYRGALNLLREMDELIRRERVPSSGRIKGAVRGLTESVLENREAMLELTCLKNHDEYTFYHSANVSILALALGSMISEEPRFLASLGVGSLLHDIGKMSISTSVLNKPGALSPEEWEEIRCHPVSGARIASGIAGLDKAAIVVVLEHHMRFDGTGYPSHPGGPKQHLASRIVAVADAYDAMTSRRSYSAARMQDEAIELLARSSGTALDPDLVRLFINMMGVYPPRSVVRLSDGSTAVVAHPGHGGPTKPVVRVIAAPGGEMVEPYRADLGESGSPEVVRTIDPADLNIDIDDYLQDASGSERDSLAAL